MTREAVFEKEAVLLLDGGETKTDGMAGKPRARGIEETLLLFTRADVCMEKLPGDNASKAHVIRVVRKLGHSNPKMIRRLSSWRRAPGPALPESWTPVYGTGWGV